MSWHSPSVICTRQDEAAERAESSRLVVLERLGGELCGPEVHFDRLGLVRQPWVKSSLAPGSKAVALYLEGSGLDKELQKLGFGIVAFACTTCNGMSGALDPKIQQEIIARDLYATAVLSGNRNFDGRIHPYAKQAFLA